MVGLTITRSTQILNLDVRLKVKEKSLIPLQLLHPPLTHHQLQTKISHQPTQPITLPLERLKLLQKNNVLPPKRTRILLNQLPKIKHKIPNQRINTTPNPNPTESNRRGRGEGG